MCTLNYVRTYYFLECCHELTLSTINVLRLEDQGVTLNDDLIVIIKKNKTIGSRLTLTNCHLTTHVFFQSAPYIFVSYDENNVAHFSGFCIEIVDVLSTILNFR